MLETILNVRDLKINMTQSLTLIRNLSLDQGATYVTLKFW